MRTMPEILNDAIKRLLGDERFPQVKRVKYHSIIEDDDYDYIGMTEDGYVTDLVDRIDPNAGWIRYPTLATPVGAIAYAYDECCASGDSILVRLHAAMASRVATEYDGDNAVVLGEFGLRAIESGEELVDGEIVICMEYEFDGE